MALRTDLEGITCTLSFVDTQYVADERGICDLGPTWFLGASLVAQMVKNLPAMQETWV